MFFKESNPKWSDKMLMFLPDSTNKNGSLYSIKAESLFLCTELETETSKSNIILTPKRENLINRVRQIDELSLLERETEEKDFSFLFNNFRGVITGYPYHIIEIDFESSYIDNFHCDILEITDSGDQNKPLFCINFYSFCYDVSDCATVRLINHIECKSPLFSINLIPKSGQIVMLDDGWSNTTSLSINKFANFVSRRDNSNHNHTKQKFGLGPSRESFSINSIRYSFDFDNRNIILQSGKTEMISKYKVHSNSSMDPWDDDVEDYKQISIWAKIKFTEKDLVYWIMRITSLGKYSGNKVVFEKPITIKEIENSLCIHFLSNVEFNSYRY